ncbi:3D domain-containing protein [Alloalcanivorax gelatiniphagus]|uniref:3D domain-containing protein n=1 Tax=Alloalcanivorax gelatiniphagus TaxID=1194167 RepID=UPI001F0DBE4B|nr:3D domain-containing protein [Alloalcanivorax gelatiniphagus]
MTSTQYRHVKVKSGFRPESGRRPRAAALLLAVLGVAAPVAAPARNPPAEAFKDSTTVTATAYNSLEGQGAGDDHSLAAWGDTLVPGMKAIAVSRDLIGAGLDYGTPVRIEGLDGVWYVRDKMHSRWRNKIDIYMGEDQDAARDWGRRRVIIHWGEE